MGGFILHLLLCDRWADTRVVQVLLLIKKTHKTSDSMDVDDGVSQVSGDSVHSPPWTVQHLLLLVDFRNSTKCLFSVILDRFKLSRTEVCWRMDIKAKNKYHHARGQKNRGHHDGSVDVCGGISHDYMQLDHRVLSMLTFSTKIRFPLAKWRDSRGLEGLGSQSIARECFMSVKVLTTI